MVLFINIINITQFWAKGKQKEIGIRKAFGGTNRNIILRIIFEYQLISIFAAILAVLSVFLLKHYPKVFILIEQSNFNRDTYMQSVFFMIIFSVILGTVTALIPVKQVLKMEANDIIRGRLK
jgi:putative ABC transport system permease protein